MSGKGTSSLPNGLDSVIPIVSTDPNVAPFTPGAGQTVVNTSTKLMDVSPDLDDSYSMLDLSGGTPFNFTFFGNSQYDFAINATVGLENSDGTRRSMFSYKQKSVSDEFAIRFKYQTQ